MATRIISAKRGKRGTRSSKPQNRPTSTSKATAPASWAADLAYEISEERGRLSCLAEAIREQLVAPPGEDSPQLAALGLAEILADLLSDCEQTNRLVDAVSAGKSSHP